MLMTEEEYADYTHIMEEESYRETVTNKRINWSQTECIPARAKQNYRDTKKGDMLTNRNAMRQASDALTESDGPPTSDRNQCCHICKNDSMAPNGFVCINPAHLYWGSRSDNAQDKSPESRAAGPKASANLQATCPHCGKTGQLMNMKRWHFDRCKLKK